MKTSVTGIGLIIVIALSIMINLNILNFTSRSSELNSAINNAVVDTQRVLYDKSYPINNFDEYISEFTQNIMQYINSNSSISIKVYAADEKIGLLDVGIVSTYHNPTGKKREYEIRRTSIIDRLKNEDFKEEDLKDKFYISFSIANDIQLDLSDVDFSVAKDEAKKVIDIPFSSGTITNVNFEGSVTGKYSKVIIDGKTYLRLEFEAMEGDVLVKIQ